MMTYPNDKKHTILKVTLGVIAFLVFVGIVGSLSNKQTVLVTNSQSNSVAPASAPTPNNSQQRPITASERTYFGAVGSYLQTANTQGTNLAQTMTGASNGSSTLGDIKTAILSAKRIENAAYQGDYKNRINGNVPSSVTDIATNVDETHRLFQAAMNELLEYWADQNTAHITSGGNALQRCVTLMNATIAQTTEKMKQLSAK